MADLRRIVEEAVDGDSLREVVAGLVSAARKGDVQAARTILEHAIGRPRTAPTFVDVPAPGELVDAHDIAATMRRLAVAASRGELDIEAATASAALVGQVATATAWADIADRLARLESSK